MNFKPARKEPEVNRYQYEKVTRFMNKSLVTISPSENAFDAMDFLLEKRISGAPVLDDSGKLIGIITESDFLKMVLDRAYDNHPVRGNLVKDYMTTDLTTVNSDMDLFDVAQMFTRSPYKRFPVLENGKLLGLVSRRDILKAALLVKSTTW
ncbi:CBS domain-containing protein [Persicobacter sp. CCB-QB2]|uniref:CBS domain-containing protein n=1 Tax=Persicobacter sp. CCB-QB2 TaxID=1561025 RepID=UPI0006A99394|nr:CBS domain-containing protein [Persicobacter sp. CCB-QB2]